MDDKYLLAVYAYTAFGPKRTSLLLEYFESAEKIWRAENKELLEIGLSRKIVEGFANHRKEFDIKKYLSDLDKNMIKYITFKDSIYPQNLTGLDNAPLVIYYKGNLGSLHKDAVAIVGTRKATSYGREVAYKFAQSLSDAGVVVVSGLALGIDAVAHKAVVDAGGVTVAVLGCGLDTIYPATNLQLGRKILEKGVIISEYPLGYPALPPNFANRNRIISGLSRAVLVVEGARKSGTLLTASAAAEQGRQVFAIPGQITSPMSEASHFLIQNGARIAFKPADIIEELDLQFSIEKAKVSKVLPDTKEEKSILKILTDPLLLDEIVRKTEMKTSEVTATLTLMELKGMVKSIEGKYKKK